MIKVEEYNTVEELNERLKVVSDHKVRNITPMPTSRGAPIYVLEFDNRE